MSWTAAAQIVSAAAMLVLPRLFPPEQFGVFSVFSGFVVLLGIVAAARYEFAIGLPRDDDEGAALFTLCFALTTVVAVIFFIVLQCLPDGNWLFRRFPEMRPWWTWAVAGVVCVGWYNAASYLALRGDGFHAVGTSKIAIALVTATGQILTGQFFSGSSKWLILPFLAGQLAGILIILLAKADSSIWNAKPQVIFRVAKRYARFPKYVAPGSILDGIAAMLPVIALAATLSVADAGYYALAERTLRMPVTLIGSSVLQVFYRRMAELRHDPTGGRHLLLMTWRSMALLAAIPCLLLIVFGELLFGLVFGSSWQPSGRVAEILVIWVFAQFVSYPTSNVLVVKERTRSFLLWQVSQLAIVLGMLLLAYYLYPGSLEGTVTLLVSGQVVVCALSMWLQWRAAGRAQQADEVGG